MRKSFTLLEMIFVVIILGILGTLSSEIVLNMYRTYVLQKGIARVEISLKTTIEQLTNHIERSIKPSLSIVLNNGTYENINYINTRSEGNFSAATPPLAFVWVGKDVESMQGIWDAGKNMVYPGYSGFANVKASSGKDINTSDSNLDSIDSIQSEITNITVTAERSALYFVYADSNGTTQQRFWDPNPSSLFSIASYNTVSSGDADDNITLYDTPEEIGDIYYLTYSAYAVTYNQGTQQLNLVWNFRPWKNPHEDYSDGTSRLLLENVTKFQVWSESGGSIIRFYICAGDVDIRNAIGNDNWEYCKESVVIR